jgi:hypothetical protein
VANKKILLIEPSYKNKYPPLGLMKIAQYHGSRGKNDKVTFVKGEDPAVLEQSWDRIYITTLFSFEWKKIEKSIDFALKVSNFQPFKIFVGGIAASLMQEEFLAQEKWRGIRFIKGLLSSPPAEALQLDDFMEELYSDDLSGQPIEDLIPDYGILKQVDYEYPVNDAYFLYASRGCVRKCKFCGVPKLEGAQRDMGPISNVVRGITSQHGEKKDLILMDNNVVASPNYKEIIAEIVDLGFGRGATLERNGITSQRRVDFNQGVDARILCKDEMYLREMSKICISPLRIAFDHIGVRKPYEQAIRYAAEFGLTKLSNYMLYNFHDTPQDLYQRMRLNIDLNEELGIRIFSFPMRYQPVDLKDRSHVGTNWKRYFLRNFQIILQATHGVVSGAPTFFSRAFGPTEEEFLGYLHWPQHFLFNREYYDELEGSGEKEEFITMLNKLSEEERIKLVTLLSSCTPSKFSELTKLTTNSKLKNILRFYIPLDGRDERKIWDICKERRKNKKVEITLAPDELVEDAGLLEAV